MKQDLYTIQEVSVLLGVTPKTLRRWEETGKITSIRTVGNQRRYRIEDIKKLERRLNLQRARQEIRKEMTATAPVENVSVSQILNTPEENAQTQQPLNQETNSVKLSGVGLFTN